VLAINPITARTQILCVIGHPLEHSMSPIMHNAAIKDLGLDYIYISFNILPKNLRDAVNGFKALNIKGINVTLPFKQSIIKYLDEIDEWREDDHEEWKNKDNMVIHDSIFDEEENFLEVYTYDTQSGFLTQFQIIDEDGTVIYEYGLSQFIPGYEIPLILGITGIIIIGLIYIVKKRNNLNFN